MARTIGAKQKQPTGLGYVIKNLQDYRKIIDYCIKSRFEGTMSQRDMEAITRVAKTGAEVFVAVQYMKAIGLDKMDLEGDSNEPVGIQAREKMLEIPTIQKETRAKLTSASQIIPEDDEVEEDLW